MAYRAVRGGVWVALSSYWMVGFGFAATIILTRLLPPEAFGRFTLAMFFAQLVRLQPKLGLGYAFAQDQSGADRATSTFVILDTAAAVTGLVLCLLAAPLLLQVGYGGSVIGVAIILAGAAMAEGLAGIGATLLEKQLHFRPASLIQSLAFPISYLPAFWLAAHDGGVWSLIAQNVTFNVLTLIGVWWVVLRRWPYIRRMSWRLDRTLVRRYLRFGLPVGASMLAGMLMNQFDNFLVGTLVGETGLGFYDRGYRTAQWPTLLLNSLIARTAFFTYARLQADRARLEKTVTMMLWIVTMVALPLALALFITAPDFITIAYTDRWLPSTPFLRIFVLVSVARPFWENAGALFVALGKPHLTLRFTVIQAVVLVSIGLPLTLAWGAPGTCVAVGLAALTGLALIYRSMRAEISLRLWPVLGAPVIVAGLIVLGYLALSRLTGLNALGLWERAILKVVYTVTVFFGLTFLAQPGLTRERVQYVWRLARQRE